jgi:hypothetical protein
VSGSELGMSILHFNEHKGVHPAKFFTARDIIELTSLHTLGAELK